MDIKEISDRVKHLILHPKKEWSMIQYEHSTNKDLILNYALPIAAAAAIATFIGYGLIGYNTDIVKISGVSSGLILGINQFIEDLATILLGGYIIDALAPYHRAEKNLEASMQLMAYAYTPVMLGNILNIIPSLAIIGNLFGLYGVVLLYLGIAPMKKVPEQKKIVYLILIIFAIFILKLLIGYFLNGFFGNPYQDTLQNNATQPGIYST